MVSPSTRRRAARSSVGEGLGSTAAADRALGLVRSSYYHTSQHPKSGTAAERCPSPWNEMAPEDPAAPLPQRRVTPTHTDSTNTALTNALLAKNARLISPTSSGPARATIRCS